MSEVDSIVEELESYLLSQHRVFCETMDKFVVQEKLTNINKKHSSWYKYIVDNHPSTIRYRVISNKEPYMTTSSKASQSATGETNTESTAGSKDTIEESGRFVRAVDWLAAKIKANRGLLGIATGVGLTYAAQAIAEEANKRIAQEEAARRNEVANTSNQ